MGIDIKQPDKRCPKCGELIPANGQATFSHPGSSHRALLICERCAIDASPPTPRGTIEKGKLRMKGKAVPEQGSFDAPLINIK